LVRNRSHNNVAHLFGEEKRMISEEQTLTVVEDVIGTYPNVLFDIEEPYLDDFIDRLATLESAEDYRQLLSKYAIRRSNKGFWDFSDELHDSYFKQSPLEAGMLDFNRLENR
jgi:hypothetical protein